MRSQKPDKSFKAAVERLERGRSDNRIKVDIAPSTRETIRHAAKISGLPQIAVLRAILEQGAPSYLKRVARKNGIDLAGLSAA